MKSQYHQIHNLLLILIIAVTFSCCKNNVDKTAEEYCDCLKKNQLSIFEERVICQEKLTDFYLKYTDVSILKEKEAELDSTLTVICKDYVQLKKYYEGNSGDWEIFINNDSLNNDARACEAFKEITELYYLEPNGDTVRLSIHNGMWIDNFSNGKYYSYLKMIWKSSCSFNIEMVETTEPNRKSAFKKGDVFSYNIIEKQDHCFIMSVTYNENSQKFKLYY